MLPAPFLSVGESSWGKCWFLDAGCPRAPRCPTPWGERERPPDGPRGAAGCSKGGTVKRAELLLLRLAENRWGCNKDKFNHIEKSGNNLVLGRLWDPFLQFFFCSYCLMRKRMGERKTDVPDTAGISDNLTPKIILLYRNWFCSFSFTKNNREKEFMFPQILSKGTVLYKSNSGSGGLFFFKSLIFNLSHQFGLTSICLERAWVFYFLWESGIFPFNRPFISC